MSTKEFEAARADLELASKCQKATHSASLDYQAACVVGDWERAKEARATAIGSFEAFFDNYAAAYQVMNRGQ
jgi:hypothetical protein